jgi:hypothetical protein
MGEAKRRRELKAANQEDPGPDRANPRTFRRWTATMQFQGETVRVDPGNDGALHADERQRQLDRQKRQHARTMALVRGQGAK